MKNTGNVCNICLLQSVVMLSGTVHPVCGYDLSDGEMYDKSVMQSDLLQLRLLSFTSHYYLSADYCYFDIFVRC